MCISCVLMLFTLCVPLVQRREVSIHNHTPESIVLMIKYTYLCAVSKKQNTDFTLPDV